MQAALIRQGRQSFTRDTYWTAEPRGTRDLDVNVFIPSANAGLMLAALPDAVRVTPADRRALEETGQARLWWDDTPVDVFLDYAPIHAAAARNRRDVPFEGETIPVLGPVDHVGVIATLAHQGVGAGPAIEAVIAGGAVHGVVAGRADRPSQGSARDRRVVRLQHVQRHPGGGAAAVAITR